MADSPSTRPGIDPALKGLLDAFPFTFTADDGVEAAREMMRQLKAPPESLPEMRIEERTVGHGDIGDVPVRIYWPPVDQHADLPVVVFYHGGGRSIGDLDTHDPVARAHAIGAEAIVVSVDYRLAPEHPFPKASRTPGPRCGGSANTPPNSVVTRRASRSPGTRPAAISRRS